MFFTEKKHVQDDLSYLSLFSQDIATRSKDATRSKVPPVYFVLSESKDAKVAGSKHLEELGFGASGFTSTRQLGVTRTESWLSCAS